MATSGGVSAGARTSSGPPKKKEALTAIVARLEADVRVVQQRLLLEAARNAHATRRIALLRGIHLATLAISGVVYSIGEIEELDATLGALNQHSQVLLQQMMATQAASAGGGAQTTTLLGATSSAASAGDAAAADLALTLHGLGAQQLQLPVFSGPRFSVAASMGGTPAAAAGPLRPQEPPMPAGSGVASGGGAVPPLISLHLQQLPPGVDLPLRGAVGVGPAEFIHAIADARGLHCDKAGFIEFWRSSVMQLALLLHQLKGGCQSVNDSSRYGGVLLSQPWMSEMMGVNLETGEMQEPPQRVWDQVVKGMALNPHQASVFVQLNSWWVATAATLTRQRRELASRALAAPQDLHVQAASLDALERVQRWYLVCAASTFVLGLTSLLSPEQMAEVWVTCWPYMSVATAILDACRRIHCP